MRAVYLFFVSLSLLLLSGNNYAHTAARHKNPFLPAHHTAKAQLIKFSIRGEEHTFVKNINVSEDKEYLITDEEDDEHDSSANKYTELTKYSLLFTYTLFLGYFYSSFKNKLPLCNHFSYINSNKYLSQRVLRI